MANKYKHLSKVKDRKKEKSCTNKKRFETEADAYQKGQFAYYCTICKGYHRSGSLISAIRGYYAK